ncbi:MAG TPA: GreA/GreB family elongation factor [Myxococcales bacterium]
MSKAFTSEETELPPEVVARPPPLVPKPLDEQTRERLQSEGVARLYAHVTLEADGERVQWQLVGPDEADPAAGRLSIDSPLGRAILGKREGDDVRFVRPKGAVEYELVSVRY